jgi:parvulin-like peptidyl-prolyl isomerase
LHARAREVVVAVNGTVIDSRAFYRRLETAAGPQTIRTMVSEEMEYQYAKKLGVAPTDAQVNARYAEASKQAGFEQWLAGKGQSADDFKLSIRSNLSRLAVLTRGMNISDAEVHRYYAINADKKNPNARYYTPASASIAVIVTKTQAQSESALAQLSSGKTFEAVAKAVSIDISRSNGGHLPPMHLGRTRATRVPGLEQAVFNLRIGDQLGPRNFSGVWWIIRLLDKKIERTIPISNVALDCHDAALLTKVSPATVKSSEAGYTEFQKQSSVQAFWERYQQAVTLN